MVSAIQGTLQPLLRMRRLSGRALLALGLLIAIDLLVIFDIVIWSGQRFRPPPVSFIGSQAIFVGEMFFAVAYGVMGWVIATRVPRNRLGWLFMLMGLGMAAQMAVTFLVQQGHQAFRTMDSVLLFGAWVASSVHLPSLVACFAMAFSWFPDGRSLSRRWSSGPWLATIGSILVIVSIGLSPVGLVWYPSLSNLFSLPEAYAPLLAGIGGIGLIVAVVGVLIASASIAVRYRRSHDEERAQIRWIGVAVLLIAGAGLPFLVARYALNMDYQTGETMLAIALAAGCFLPIAAAIAITRYRLYNIDNLINRALVYIPLTGILGGLYAAGVALFQRIFVTVTGDKSDAAIVLATLVLASLFTPIKNSLQTFVDKRYKPVTKVETPAPAHVHTHPDMKSLAARLDELEDRLDHLSHH
jgi:hypothetical protein